MKSRNSFAPASSLFALSVLVGCSSPPDHKQMEWRTPVPLSDFPEEAMTTQEEGVEGEDDDVWEIGYIGGGGGGVSPKPASEKVIVSSSEDPCPAGQRRYEGTCRPRKAVANDIERRERDALASVRKAQTTKELVDAQHELLQQQVQQVGQVEQDLDEILELLREENRVK